MNKIWRQLVVNVISNYAMLIIYGIGNFFLAGYCVRKLGGDAFGLVSLVISVAMATDLLGTGVCQALTKYVAYYQGKNRDTIQNLIYASLSWFIFSAIIGSGIIYYLGNHITVLFKIPAEYANSSRLCMDLMALKTLVCFPFNIYQGILYGYQRYDLTNLSKNISVIGRILGIVVYFELVKPGITAFVGISILSFTIERALWAFFSHRVHGSVGLGGFHFSRSDLRIVIGFGGVMLIIHVANLIGYEVVKWVIGKGLSVLDVGGYTLIASLAAFAASLVRSISNALMPAASRLNSLKRHDTNAKLAILSTKYAMFVAGASMILPLPLMGTILRLWVGKGYTTAYIHSLTISGIVLLLGQWFVTSPVCLLQMQTGLGKIKAPAIVTSCWSLAAVVTVFIAIHFFNGTLFSVAVILSLARGIGAIANIINGINDIKLLPSALVYHGLARPACAAIIGFLLIWGIEKYQTIETMSGLIATVLAGGTLYCVTSWFFVLNSQERQAVFKMVNLNYVKNKLFRSPI